MQFPIINNRAKDFPCSFHCSNYANFLRILKINKCSYICRTVFCVIFCLWFFIMQIIKKLLRFSFSSFSRFWVFLVAFIQFSLNWTECENGLTFEFDIKIMYGCISSSAAAVRLGFIFHSCKIRAKIMLFILSFLSFFLFWLFFLAEF